MNKASIPWNGNQIYRSVMNGSLVFDNAIQRHEVWNAEKKSAFIESLIRGYLVLPIVTVRTNEKVQTKKGMVSVYDCIDGKQRCTTLTRYINDEFALTGLKPFYIDGNEIDLNGKKFSELDEEWQDNIKSFGFNVFYLSEIDDEEVAEIMSRLNNGKELTGIEKARIKSLCLPSVIALAKHPLLMDNLSATAINGYANEDIVMKSLLLMNGDSDLSSKNVRLAYEAYDLTAPAGKDASERLTAVMDIVEKVVFNIREEVEAKEIKKKVLSKIISKTNLITIIYAVSRLKDTVSVDEIIKAVKFFYAPTDTPTICVEYNEACTNGTMHGANVEARNEALLDYFTDLYGEDIIL